MFVNNWPVKTGTNSHHMEHGALHLCDVFTRWVLRWWWLWHVYTDMDGGGPRAELLARVADIFSRCWKLEATSQTLECSMHGWWDGNLAHISRISPQLHTPQHLPNFNKVSVSHRRFSPAWQTLFVSPRKLCWCCGVPRCGHMSPPDPDLASSGPRLGVATLKDPGTKVKDFH